MAGMEGMAKRVGVDKWIFFTTLLLVGVGLAMVFSASAVVAQEQRPYDVHAVAGDGAAGVVGEVGELGVVAGQYDIA